MLVDLPKNPTASVHLQAVSSSTLARPVELGCVIRFMGRQPHGHALASGKLWYLEVSYHAIGGCSYRLHYSPTKAVACEEGLSPTVVGLEVSNVPKDFAT